MIDNVKVVAILTVLDNSKRFPGKTFAPFGNGTLISHTIDKIRATRYIDYGLISTDVGDGWTDDVSDEFIIIPRPSHLMGDSIPILPVVQDAAQWIQEEEPVLTVWIDYTKPLTPIASIEQCIEVAWGNGYDSVFTVRPLRGALVDDEAICSQLKPEQRFQHFGACRVRTLDCLKAAQLGTWGTGKRHKNLPIVKDWEIDVDYEYDIVQARAVYDWGKEWGYDF